MGVARIQAAAGEVSRVSELCTEYLAAHPHLTAPPTVLLHQLAAAGRELVLAVGEHVAHSEPAALYAERVNPAS